MSSSITQIRQITLIRNITAEKKEIVNLTAEDLGQDAVCNYNIAPRKKERSTQMGKTSMPMTGTFDNFTASITVLADTFKMIGELMGKWNKARYDGATDDNGNIVGDGSDLCAAQNPVTVVVWGVCDDGSSTDLCFPRCYPSIDDEMSIGSSSTPEVTLQLNPQIYNATAHAGDAVAEKCSYRFGDFSLTEKKRFNATTGEYEKVEPIASA